MALLFAYIFGAIAFSALMQHLVGDSIKSLKLKMRIYVMLVYFIFWPIGLSFLLYRKYVKK